MMFIKLLKSILNNEPEENLSESLTDEGSSSKSIGYSSFKIDSHSAKNPLKGKGSIKLHNHENIIKHIHH